MPTIIGQKYDIDWRGRPPHMLDADVPVWYRFLETYGAPFIALYYDCLLGGPFLTLQQKIDPLMRMWQYNTSKRADAIAETAAELLIIEVASYPGLRAVGQLQTYQALWIEDPKITKPERLLLVAERIDADLAAACARFGIQIYIV